VFVGNRESDMLALTLRAKELEYAADFPLRCQQQPRAAPGRQAVGSQHEERALGRGGDLIDSEVDPPPATQPAVWRLLTNRIASTLQEACELIDWYRMRWGAPCQNPLAGHAGHRRLRARFALRP